MTVEESISLILRTGYHEVSDPCGGFGAQQLIDGKWYSPRWGCDTIQHIFDALREQEDNE